VSENAWLAGVLWIFLWMKVLVRSLRCGPVVPPRRSAGAPEIVAFDDSGRPELDRQRFREGDSLASSPFNRDGEITGEGCLLVDEGVEIEEEAH
jgi:hypothetical protein